MTFMAALPRAGTTIGRGMEEGLHLGAQVYVSLDGRVVADDAIGELRPGVPMTADVLWRWFSSTKPIAGVAIGQLWEQGKLDVADRVCRYIPEFGVNGKDAITIRHVLTHTGGFRTPDDDSVPTTGKFAGTETRPTWDEIIARVCEAELQPGWVPGRTAAYQGLTGFFVLAEIVRGWTGGHIPGTCARRSSSRWG